MTIVPPAMTPEGVTKVIVWLAAVLAFIVETTSEIEVKVAALAGNIGNRFKANPNKEMMAKLRKFCFIQIGLNFKNEWIIKGLSQRVEPMGYINSLVINFYVPARLDEGQRPFSYKINKSLDHP